MDIIAPIQNRRAFRALEVRPVDSTIRDRLLAAATLAPSCMNKQPWRFVAVDAEPHLGVLKACLEPGNYWGQTSPLIFAVVTNPDLDCRLSEGRDYAYFDTGMAAMNLMIQATAEGLTAHPIAGFKPVEAKKVLDIPDDYTLLTLIICGWPSSDLSSLNEKHTLSETAPRSRKPQAELAFLQSWPKN